MKRASPEEDKSDPSNCDITKLDKTDNSIIVKSSNGKFTVTDKTSQPTLNELLEDEMEDKFGVPRAKAEIDKQREERLAHNRKRADYILAVDTLQFEKIRKKDDTRYSVICSGISSICELQEYVLYDYLYFLKKLGFLLIVVGLIYCVNLSHNITSSYLYEEDRITGLEKTSLANIDGLPFKARFKTERDEGIENVESSRALTAIMDFIATIMILGMVMLRMRWRVYPSDYAVKVHKIDSGYNGDIEKDISHIFDNKFGRVHEVAVVKGTGDYLKYQMKISHITERIGDYRAKEEICGAGSSKPINRLSKAESKFNERLSKLREKFQTIGHEKIPIKEVYVIFEKPEDKKKALEIPKGRLELSNGIYCTVSNTSLNPNQKIYENISYPNWKKFLRLAIVTSILVSLSIAVITPLMVQLNSAYDD